MKTVYMLRSRTYDFGNPTAKYADHGFFEDRELAEEIAKELRSKDNPNPASSFAEVLEVKVFESAEEFLDSLSPTGLKMIAKFRRKMAQNLGLGEETVPESTTAA